MSDIYAIPVTWESYGIVRVAADSPEEALEKFKKNVDKFELPQVAHYVDDSFKLSADSDEENLAMIIPNHPAEERIYYLDEEEQNVDSDIT